MGAGAVLRRRTRRFLAARARERDRTRPRAPQRLLPPVPPRAPPRREHTSLGRAVVVAAGPGARCPAGVGRVRRLGAGGPTGGRRDFCTTRRSTRRPAGNLLVLAGDRRGAKRP